MGQMAKQFIDPNLSLFFQPILEARTELDKMCVFFFVFFFEELKARSLLISSD